MRSRRITIKTPCRTNRKISINSFRGINTKSTEFWLILKISRCLSPRIRSSLSGWSGSMRYRVADQTAKILVCPQNHSLMRRISHQFGKNVYRFKPFTADWSTGGVDDTTIRASALLLMMSQTSNQEVCDYGRWTGGPNLILRFPWFPGIKPAILCSTSKRHRNRLKRLIRNFL